MPKHKNTAAIVTFSDHEVIKPDYKLRKALINPPYAPDAADENELVARAEAALAGLANQFESWMKEECLRLDRARNNVMNDGFTPDNKLQLFRAAHDIKGEAATFGFPAVAAIADSLCRLIEYAPDMQVIPLTLIDQHVDAIRAICREHSELENENPDTELARKLTYRLREVTDEFLIHENRERPDILEQIASGPSIVPE
ncbi:MAG: Hpt domain-containing protein [Rhodopseudomonas sp.]|nr:Hpt domain-containing protein [Rhodopseudomonas sp.]